MSASPLDALLRTPRKARFDRCQEAAPTLKTSLAGQVRNLLRRDGPSSAASICMEVDIPSTSLVSAVLKHDLARGCVKLINGLYELDSGWDEELQQKISQAKTLLERNGYSVEKRS